MRVCPVCSYENPHGALICAKCYHLLVEVKGDQIDSTLANVTSTADTRILPSRRPIDTSTLSGNIVVMHFDDFDKPLVVYVSQQTILGRRTSDPTVQPRIDLTPYGAVAKGISRVHVMLRRTESGLTIEDLASSNGTWVNGARIPAYTRTVLKSGDHVLLGELAFDIYFRSTGG